MLKRKMFRDIKTNLSQFITILLMVFMGVMVYSGIRSYMDGMVQTADVFYGENNAQDLDVSGINFTKDDLEKIKSLDNVNNAERKLTIMANMESDEDRTLQLNFIESNDISKFYVKDGTGFDKEAKGAWIDYFFAKNNNIKVGDTIKLTYDKENFEEKVLGLIEIPDHVYDVKDESVLFPNHIDYGFCYLSVNEFPEHYIKKQAMAKMNISNEDIFNSVVKDFKPKDYLTFNYIMVDVDNEANKNKVKNEIEDNVKDALAITDFKDSFSYSTYQGEIEEGETYVGIFSGLFLFIAMLSVITTMTRVIKKQRVQLER